MNRNDNDDREGPLPEWSQRAAERLAQRAAQRETEAGPIPERTGDALAFTDDNLRHHSAARLAEQLDIVTGLAEHCERLAGIPTQDRIAPIHAAARLMTASALVATALAKVTSAETRQRAIIEHVQPVATKKPDLNANLDACGGNGPPNPSDLGQQAAAALDGLLFDTLQRKMLLYMNLVAGKTFDADLKKAYPEAYAPGGALGEPSAKPSAPV